jgi:hypothetical protein
VDFEESLKKMQSAFDYQNPADLDFTIMLEVKTAAVAAKPH